MRKATVSLFALLFVLGGALSSIEVPLFAAVSLTSVAPLGASAGISLQIIGNGFDPSADRNLVLITPATGAQTQVVPDSITVLDASKNLRRLGIRLPAGLATGNALVQVRNLTTGELSSGRTLQIVQLALPETVSAVRGTSQVAVRITGSSNLAFVAGRSTVTFGAGVTVSTVQVQSPTTLIATISIASTAAPGPRTVIAVNPTQTAQLVDGFTVTDIPPPTLTSIDLQPGHVRFTTVGDTRTLTVAGHRSDGQTLDLTAPSTGTTYHSSNRFVASVDPQGALTAIANGDTTITATNGNLTDSATVAVEIGVALEALQLTPSLSTLRTAGAIQSLTLTGTFSDGSARNLTTAAGTTYESSNTNVATVAADGRVTAVANGSATITARQDARSATAGVTVQISGGTGFVRGEVFDDTKGLPLGAAIASLVSDGGGPLPQPLVVTADDRGQFSLPGRAGQAIVRITKPGFTTVERIATIPVNGSTTAIDARLTPFDAHANLIGSAAGGTAISDSTRATLQVPPGGLTSDARITLTWTSAQGLANLLPAGWSPVAAVTIDSANTPFGFPLSLTLTNGTALPAGTSAALARYDFADHQWVASGTAAIASGGQTFTTSVAAAGQYAVLVPDAAPHTPPAAVTGTALAGVERPIDTPAGVTAAGDVVPRSAPPGDSAKATGRVALTSATPVPSGTLVQLRVSERFDLLDESHVVTQPFTQDLVTYATPQPVDGSLGATFPITPSRNFTIQELMLGVIRVDVTPFTNDVPASVVGAEGGTITNAMGDSLQIPATALNGATAIALRRLSASESGIDSVTGFDLLGAIAVDAVGLTLTQSAQLALATSVSLPAQSQLLIAAAFTDSTGQRRLRLVAVGELVSGHIVTRTTFGSVTLAGIRTNGDFVFLRAQQPVGLVTGSVTRTGNTPAVSALITSNSTPIADVTSTTGGFVIPVNGGVDVAVNAVDPASGDTGSATVRVDAGQVLAANLALNAVGPSVVAVSPVGGATNVPLDTSIAIDFSKPIDAASITDASVSLRLDGTVVDVQRTLSATRRRLTITPSSALSGTSTYSLTVTSAIRDLVGNPLSAFAPISFTTLDPSRPEQPAPGRIIAELPDENGDVLVTGAAGVAAGNAAVTLTNLRTQETVTVVALADGSFRTRITARVGDVLILTLHGADGRDTTIRITQFVDADGSTSIGDAGGAISGPNGLVGTILPRALAQSGIFRLTGSDGAAMPVLPDRFAYVSAFALSVDGAIFRSLTSITLSENQNRFPPVSAFTAPLSVAGDLATPADALVNSSLGFSAVAQDADGVRHTVGGSTRVTAATPDASPIETSHAADFPTLFLTTPREAVPSQVVQVKAVAPAARIELEQPAPSGLSTSGTLLLAQPLVVGSDTRLLVVDTLAVSVATGGQALLRTSGRELPGATASGDYAIVSSSDTLVFATGVVSGPQALVIADGLPFVFRTNGPNGRFALPVHANQAFTLRFLGLDGTGRGSATGQAPSTGTVDVGNPLGASAGRLTVRVEPDARSIVDIGAPLLLQFSEPIDERTLSNAFIVSDDGGRRVFGRTVVSVDALSATFTPTRRWRYGTTYRYGASLSLLARSGARLDTPVTGQFTTFQPIVTGTLAVGDARDVGVAGVTAVVATNTGIQTLNVSSPRDPRALGTAALPGGAGAVALLTAATLVDRAGATHSGPLAIVGAGSQSTPGSVQTFDVSNAASPTLLGSTQLTTTGGQPLAVTVDADGAAFVAIESVGVASVNIGQTIPLDSTNPSHGLGARYPGGALTESASDVTRVGTRLFVAGTSGLTVLDAETLQRLGGVSTTGAARGIAGTTSFRMDVNGDGVIAPDIEVFDIAAIANGSDGTLQLYQVPTSGDPILLSVVRFAGAETTSVDVNATERLAYVGLGPRGVAIVDLSGPASVQPLDDDHNGLDDRLLGTIDVGGTVNRLALDLQRGVGYVADGPGGLATLQLAPPRSKFLTMSRDPVVQVTGDERPLGTPAIAYVSDDRLSVSVDLLAPPNSDVLLLIDEAGASDRLLAFPNGDTIAALADGLSTHEIRINGSPSAAPRTITLRVVTRTGNAIASQRIELRQPQPTAPLTVLRAGPRGALLSDALPTVEVGVAGFFDDGQVFNLSSASSGTRYQSAPVQVATIDPSGLVTAGAGGVAAVVATNGAVSADLLVRVQRAPALVALRADQTHHTFRRLGDELAFPLVATFSDGTETRDLSQLSGIAFRASNDAIATVGAQGSIRATGPGVTQVFAAIAGFEAPLTVAVDPRTPTSIAAITIVPAPAPLSLDNAPLLATAVISGSGALDGIPVNVTLSSGASSVTLSESTTLSGTLTFRLDGMSAGSIAATASVVDPATGLSRSDGETFVLLPRSSDNEPNDSPTTASPITTGQTIDGTLGGGTDARDTYTVDALSDGTLEIDLQLLGQTSTGNVTLVVRDSAQREIARLTPTSGAGQISIPVPAGAAFVTVEATSGTAAYTMTTRFVQADVVVGSIAPMSGAAGTLITITGSGFSTRLTENQVFFSGIAAEVVTATPTTLSVRVPPAAVNGKVEVISGDRRQVIAGFTTGLATSRPSAYVLEQDPGAIRADPTTGSLVDITRLFVSATLSTSRQDMDTLAARHGGQVVGYIPMTNQYVLGFGSNTTIDGLNALRQQVAAEPAVRSALFITQEPPTGHSIDIFDRGGTWQNAQTLEDTHVARSRPLDQIHLHEAIDLARRTPPFTNRSALKDVHVAVIDTGFNPIDLAEFTWQGKPIFEYREYRGTDGFPEAPLHDVDGVHAGHGTNVTSIIAAVNDGTSPLSGVLNSLVDRTESPFRVYVYGRRNDSGFDRTVVALDHIKARQDVEMDVINMSFGGYLTQDEAPYADAFRAFRGRTLLVASAGNDGVSARHFPSALQRSEPHVVGVGAVASANLDGVPTEASPDERAQWPGSTNIPVRVRCDVTSTQSLPSKGSNCGSSVTLSAPGEDIYAQGPQGYTVFHGFDGTSSAAPLVSGVAAILQAIRPTDAPLAPSILKNLLVTTATDITTTWNVNLRDANGDPQLDRLEPMRRINALAAVEEMLKPRGFDSVYVTDSDLAGDGSGASGVIALQINPLSGQPSSDPNAQQIIPLTVTKSGQTLHARDASTTILSPDGSSLYVYATSDQYGDGIVVVDMSTLRAIDFIPLSGVTFPSSSVPADSIIRTDQTRPPMALSRDGRLLYVAVGLSLRIINLDRSALVSLFIHLPTAFNALALDFVGDLEARLQLIGDYIALGGRTGYPGTAISALQLTPDGKTLHLVVQTGRGGGLQPGFVISVNVDLYTDEIPGGTLQARLDDYLTFTDTLVPAMVTEKPRSDEPAGTAVSPDGRFLYIVNGGVLEFSAPTLESGFARSVYSQRVFAESTSGTLVVDIDGEQTARIKRDLENGATIVIAPGVIEAFDLTATSDTRPRPRFTSDVNHGWQPSAESGGLVLSPTSIFGLVFAKRPYDVAMHPGGRRAIVSYFQTGNFGVLDLDFQSRFPEPQLTAPAGTFKGILGVTPSIKLDQHLWPAHKSDERLLFPTEVEYSQSGHLAVGIHTGVGGGALSIINNDAITQDLQVHAGSHLTIDDTERPYFATLPICASHPPLDSSMNCETSAVTHVFDYAASGVTHTLNRPKGLAVAPTLRIKGPRFHDHVTRTAEVSVGWNSTADQLTWRLVDLGSAIVPSGSTQISSGTVSLMTTTRSWSRTVVGLAQPSANLLQRGHLYRVELTLRLTSGLTVTDSIDVVLIN